MAVAAQLGARAIAASLRVVLIRRHGRNPRGPRRSWALVDSTPGRETIAWGSFTAETELLDLPLDGSAGEGSSDACYLVCTHGRHDACCALRGRPVAAAFARARPAATWECSHVGGDRFAPNVVVLPQGLYYGRVSAAGAASIVEAHERSEVVVEHLRGRAAFRPAVQAAQHFARRQLGATAIDDLSPIGETAEPDGRVSVRFSHGSATVTATVRPSVGEQAGLLTCHALKLDTSPKIPADLVAEVRSVSAVGEQYVELMPRTDLPPYLEDGSVIAMADTKIPQAVGPMLDQVSTLINSVPKEKLSGLIDESFDAFNGAGYRSRLIV